MSARTDTYNGVEIAIVGMAGRFPGASDVDALWRNVRDRVESVVALHEEALRARGVSVETLAEPGYVRSGIVLEGLDQFDADFFGYSPREAERIDPQQRLLLESAWQALEHAGYGGDAGSALIGIYAGSGPSLYLLQHLLPSINLHDSDIAALLGLLNGSDPDSLVSRVAYKLDLRGPAVSVQTACSTSLAAVHLACRGLLNHELDVALAGGVWLNLLQGSGYRYQPGAILSPDGHCRAFDARAAGTAIGSGVGVVVLKRLDEALADGDTIHAVIRGSALNNDGAAKVGYTAPSVQGQAAAILAAQAMADVGADTIGYIEAHGTGTTLGDPIEVAALTQAFRASTERRGYCAIGSVKTNIGHLDAAAGVAGLIKTVMALKHAILPPSLNFEEANPQIDFSSSPFYVNTESRCWPAAPAPRRAGVSSFGMGGTNVHLILEEAPSLAGDARERMASAEATYALMLSARSASARDATIRALASHLQHHPQQCLSDVAHTLRVGRKRFGHRAVALVRDSAAAVRAFSRRDPGALFCGEVLSDRPSVAFLFPGQGAQHVNMGRALYQREALLRQVVDHCCELLQPELGLDLRTLLFAPEGCATAERQLAQTAVTQPALFVIEYALARWWMQQGVQPDAMLGHSIGEYVAACLADVFSLEDALRVVAARGRLLQATEPGAMLAVSLPEAGLLANAYAGCDLAAVNAADLCVLSGAATAVDSAERDLVERGVSVRRLRVSHAFHSALVEPALVEFEALLARVRLSAPRIPFVSNLSGRWITAAEACSPGYWVRHARGAVRFADGLSALFAKSDRALLEVGPGETLSALARRHPGCSARPVLASQCHPQRAADNGEQPARCLAQLWVAGIDVEAALFGETADGCAEADLAGACARRLPLPTYPFERQSYWMAPAAGSVARSAGETAANAATDARDLDDWLYVPAWKRLQPKPSMADRASQRRAGVVVIGEPGGLTDDLCVSLQDSGRSVVRVQRGDLFARLDEHRYTVRPGVREDFEQLLRGVEADQGFPSDICHLWHVDIGDMSPQADAPPDSCFFDLLALAQALAAADTGAVSLTVMASGLEDVAGTEPLCPEKAVLHGLCKVIPQEHPQIRCRVIDAQPPADARALKLLARQLAAEIDAPDGEPLVAYRGRHRWTKTYEPLGSRPVAPRLRRCGVYLITGGLGGVGLALARYLATRWQARLALLGRTLSREQAEVVAELQALGADVLILQADMADTARVHRAVAEVRSHFGDLHGVIHAAGVAGGGMIAQRQRAAIARVFAAKVGGTINLLSALAEAAPDFVLLCSSLSAITGDFGQADYCAANCFLDALATAAARDDGPPLLSVNWDSWREVGMAAAHGNLPAGVGIAPDRAGALLERLLTGPSCAQVLVSTRDLDLQLAQKPSVQLADHRVPQPLPKRQLHPRPALRTDYVAPTTEFERGMVDLWETFLGMSPIGVEDHLFELGGDSLLAIQLLAKVRHAYGVEIHPAALFHMPTIAALALLVEQRLIEQIETEDAASDCASRSSAAV